MNRSALPIAGSPVVGAEIKKKRRLHFFEATPDGQFSEGELIPAGPPIIDLLSQESKNTKLIVNKQKAILYLEHLNRILVLHTL